MRVVRCTFPFPIRPFAVKNPRARRRGGERRESVYLLKRGREEGTERETGMLIVFYKVGRIFVIVHQSCFIVTKPNTMCNRSGKKSYCFSQHDTYRHGVCEGGVHGGGGMLYSNIVIIHDKLTVAHGFSPLCIHLAVVQHRWQVLAAAVYRERVTSMGLHGVHQRPALSIHFGVGNHHSVRHPMSQPVARA